MSNKKIKYPPSAIKKCDKQIKDLMIDIIKTKQGGTTIKGAPGPERTIINRTGTLIGSIKPVIKVVDNELFIEVEVVKYFQYLDQGTNRIKQPWFFTNELTQHAKFLDAIAQLEARGIAYTIQTNAK